MTQHTMKTFIDEKLGDMNDRDCDHVHTDPASFSSGYNAGVKALLNELNALFFEIPKDEYDALKDNVSLILYDFLTKEYTLSDTADKIMGVMYERKK